jgi:putative oxidoreductase
MGEIIEAQKNVAMAGGFLTLAAFGPGSWSLDGWRGREA